MGLPLVAAAVLICSRCSRGSRLKSPSSSHPMKPHLQPCRMLTRRRYHRLLLQIGAARSDGLICSRCSRGSRLKSPSSSHPTKPHLQPCRMLTRSRYHRLLLQIGAARSDGLICSRCSRARANRAVSMAAYVFHHSREKVRPSTPKPSRLSSQPRKRTTDSAGPDGPSVVTRAGRICRAGRLALHAAGQDACRNDHARPSDRSIRAMPG